MIKFKFKKLT